MNLNPRLEKTIVTNTKTSPTEQSTQHFDILSLHSLNILPESKFLLFTHSLIIALSTLTLKYIMPMVLNRSAPLRYARLSLF